MGVWILVIFDINSLKNQQRRTRFRHLMAFKSNFQLLHFLRTKIFIRLETKPTA